MILLKMKDDAYRRCPFVSPDGCLIYKNRPGACRIYPLGRAAKTGLSHDDIEERYFMVKEPHFLGFKEERIWRVREWLKDQEMDTYNEINKYWMEVLTTHSPIRHQRFSDKKLQMFYMASYNADAFKEFIFSRKFLNRFVIKKATITKIKSDDIELLKFACQWLKFSLFGEPTLEVKDEVILAKKQNLGKLNREGR
jgi:Fe-S-cluster containining protein